MTIDPYGDGLALPDELRSLDAELSSIRYEERPSFAPELEAELVREWHRLRRRPPRATALRKVAVVAAVALGVTAMAVPSARASLARLAAVFQLEEHAPEPERSTPPEVEPEAPFVPDHPLTPPEAEEERASPAPSLGALGVPLREPVAPPTPPALVDRERTAALVRRYYPEELETLGVGGTVHLRLWVAEDGSVDFPQLARGSGIAALDRVALTRVVPELRFRPATVGGVPVGQWVEFDVRFEPRPADDAVPEPPDALVPEEPETPEPLDLSLVPEWTGGLGFTRPVPAEASELLLQALGEGGLPPHLGSAESLLQGEPPAGAAPMEWRAEVGRLMEEAMVRAPDNPAPVLALARIRRKQGLRTEARVLVERALQRAMRLSHGVAPEVVADLHYERATLLRESWRAYRDLGRVPSRALDPSLCPQARTAGGGTQGYASVERLIAWNYLCPEALGDVLARSFEALDQRALADRTVMTASFRAAVEAVPAHVGANTALLLTLADEGRWAELLEHADAFVRASGGHPYGLLLGGLALHRLGRVEDAAERFEVALRGLPPGEADAIADISFLLDGDARVAYRAASAEERRELERAFWADFDPILTTGVNERQVEHLARAAYARLRFHEAGGDAAEVWIRYGRPSRVRVFGEGSQVRTEFWDYGSGPDITFTRLDSGDALDLTPEGRAYIRDLRAVLAHRYGADSRPVFVLPGQVARFLQEGSEALDFDLYTRVPPILRRGAEGPLDLQVHFVDPAGDRIRLVARKLQPGEDRVSVRVPVTAVRGALVLEIYNPWTGRAASLREPVRPLAPSNGVVLSDLLVVEPATPGADEVFRDAPWVEPLVLTRPEHLTVAGAYFELYAPQRPVASYRLRAEVVDLESGAVVPVAVRPAGEETFREVWERSVREPGVIREYVTVAMTQLEPGRHRLRVVVEVPDGGGRITLERDLEPREEDG